MRFKPIIRNINLLNILLISVIIISISYSLLPLVDMKVKYTLPAAKKIGGEKEEKAIQTQIPSTVEYTMIAEENLFHPERKIPVEKKEEKPLPKPDLVLYGTLITDDISLAYLEDLKAPYSTPGRGKRQTALRKGDSISGFTLKEIESEKIVMVRGEEKMTVYLNEPLHPKDRKESGVTTTEPAQPQARASASSPGAVSVQQVSPPPQASSKRTRQKVPSAQQPASPEPERRDIPQTIPVPSDIKTFKGPSQKQAPPPGGGGLLGIPRR